MLSHPPTTLPNFIVAGVSKAGTEWLKRCLDEHPDIFMGGRGNFFDYHYDRGQAWYEAGFQGHDGETARGEKSTTYIINPNVPERIYGCVPAVKLLFVLREPIERAYSHYKMNLRASQVSSDVEAELSPGKALIEEGRYREQLKRFEAYFPPERLKVMLYDDLQADPEKFLEEAFDFLEVDPSFRPSLLHEHFHVTKGRPRWPRVFNGMVAVASRVERSSRLAKRTVEFARRRGYVNFVHRLNKGPAFPEMSQAHKRQLAAYYDDDVQALEQWLGRDLSHWLSVE